MKTTNEQGRIQLPPSLGLRIWDELKEKHGIEPRKNAMGLMDFSFSQEEIGLITKLKVHNPVRGNLQGISKLYNLQNLIITSDQAGDYTKDNMICTITDQEMDEIGQVRSLRSLSVSNQHDIWGIDLSRLENLEFLSITHCLQLEQVDGIDGLSKLFGLTCYGNRTLMRN